MPPKKRKSDICEKESKKHSPQTCILHMIGIEHGPFTSFKNTRGEATEKLAQLHKIRDERLAEPPGSIHRMEGVCSLIPSSLEGLDLESHGYHRQCYQRFHMNLNRLKGHRSSEATAPLTRHHSPRKGISGASSTSSPLFPPECLFCGKFETKVHGKTERPVKFASWKHRESSWQPLEHQALELGYTRLHRQIQGRDLHASEAQCHKSCRDKFHITYSNHIRSISRKQTLNTDQECKAAAHAAVFNSVVELIYKHIVEEKKIMQLSSLRLQYIAKLQENNSPNPDYRSQKLLHRLQNHDISEKISFTKVSPGDKGCVTFILIYSKDITVADAVSFAYKLASTDKFTDVAQLLRSLIQKAYKECKELPWPPTAEDLEINSEKILPEKLVRFLSLVTAGTPEIVEKSERTQRLVLSIGQDLCRAVTDGEWKLPKHILLCNTVRHLYRSKQLTTILNRLGHSESYDFDVELENAMTKAIDEMSTYLTPQIITGAGNALFHCEWDNLNKILTNVHGTNVVNSAAGIMIQEVQPGYERTQARTLPQYERSKLGSLKAGLPESLPEITIYNRDGPKFPQGSSFSHPEENKMVFAASMQRYYAWAICRMVESDGRQPVPAYGGFTSATGNAPLRKSTIDYFTSIHQPITDYSTVQELLRRSEVATAEVRGAECGQKYVVNTFDLGVCMKALPLVWKHPERYKNHIIIPGPFHTGMNYIGMVTGHKCRGSGYAEILLEAQLVTSGCLKSVLSGKAYAKAIFCLKTVCEALERLLMLQFIQEENIQINSPITILNLVKSCTSENLDLALQDHSTLELIKNVSPDVQQPLEQFTCIMYGEARETSVNAVRAKMLRKMVGENQSLTIKSKVDLSRIPPCKDSLLPHIQRVNYRVACYKKADEPLFWKPKPYDAGQGWQKTDQGMLEPVWTYGQVLPPSLVDLLQTTISEAEEENVDDLDLTEDEMLQYLDDDV